MMSNRNSEPIEDRTARLTVLIDPRKKAVLESVCAAEDVTPSQVVRRLIREYIEARLGRPWNAAGAVQTKGSAPVANMQERKPNSRR